MILFELLFLIKREVYSTVFEVHAYIYKSSFYFMLKECITSLKSMLAAVDVKNGESNMDISACDKISDTYCKDMDEMQCKIIGLQDKGRVFCILLTYNSWEKKNSTIRTVTLTYCIKKNYQYVQNSTLL